MHQPTLRELLADLFAAHGYRVSQDTALEGRSGTLYNIPILAEDDDRYVLVDCAAEEEPVGQETLDALATVIDDAGADVAVLVHLGDVDGVPDPSVLLWDRHQVAALVGDSIVAQAGGWAPLQLPLRARRVLAQTPPIDLTSELAAAASPSIGNREPDWHEADDALDFAAFDLDALASPELGSDSSTAPEGPSPTPGPPGHSLLARALRETVPAARAAPPREGSTSRDDAFPCLPMNVTLEQARHLVRDQIANVERAGLILQPVWIFDYECDLLVGGTLRSETTIGRIEVHATSREVRPIDDPIAPEPLRHLPVGIDPEERPLRTSQERALQEARQAVVAANTRVVQVQSDDPEDNFTVSEKKRVEPRPDHVRLTCLGTFHRPLWRLSGVNGSVELDAVTGELATQQLRSSSSSAVMLE